MRTRQTLLVLLLSIALSIPVLAQSSTGSISGTVTDDSGAALPGVTVTATNTATGASRSAVTNAGGYYQIALLPPATYSVEAMLEGFQAVRRDRLVVNISSAVSFDVTMKVGVSETVTVTAAAPLIETERTEVTSVVNETAIENLPVNGRNFIDFVLTTPGVVKDVRLGDISFAGQRGTLNSLVIDGANNDNTFFGQALGRTGSGRAPYQFSQDAVKEFVVNTNAYSAEYGRAGGAVINVVTKSGTNDLDGTLFYFLRDKAYNANDYINEINSRAKSPYHFDQYGASAGGPIVHDRHFFFVNYDAQRNSIPNLVVLGRPSGGFPSDADTQAGLAKINALAESYSRNQDQDVYLIKTDHELGSTNHLTFRFNRQEFVGKNFENGGITNSVEHTGDSNVTTDTYAGSLTSMYTRTVFNEVRVQYAKDQEPGLANSDMPEALIRQPNVPGDPSRGFTTVLTVGRNFFSPRETTIKRWQIADTTTFVFDKHTVKEGFDYSKDDILNYFPGNFSGSYTFDSLADYQNGKASRFLQAFAGPGTSGPTTHPNITELGLFVEDSWRLLPTLTLNLGLRYDVQGIEQPEVRNPDAQLLARGIDTSVIPEDDNNIAPRLGFAWTPGADGRTIVRGGYGIFYGRTPAIMIGTAHSNNGINVQTITFTGALIPQYPNIYTSLPTGVALPKPTIFAFDPNFQNPEVHQASLGVERAVTQDISVGVTLQHVQGNNLQRSIDANVGGSEIVTIDNVPVRRYTSARPFANFQRVILFQSSADSRYNGVTLDLNKRFANHWQARLAYTYSKVEDNKPDATAVVPGGSDDAKYLNDPLDIEGEWAVGDNDVPHRIVLSGVWDLNYGSFESGWKHWVLGGWSVSGIASYQSGQPYTAMATTDINNDLNNRSDRQPGFDRNMFRLPSIFSVDPRVTKTFAFAPARLQLIAEAFNAFNRSNVNAVRTAYTPTSTLLSGFGSPTSSAGPRIVQLAAKLSF
ncbi:MAG TPA: TonB-dependent receptor [Thermoanaerobaculia bacterium]|nr:TonB-dependent receptor [Thermoanaerobaculia bacterium]